MKRPSLVGGCQGGSGQPILGREGPKRVTGSARSLARPMSWGQALTPVPAFTLLSFTTSFTWMAEEGHVGELDGTSPCRSTTPQIHHRCLSFNATPSFSSFFLSLMSTILLTLLSPLWLSKHHSCLSGSRVNVYIKHSRLPWHFCRWDLPSPLALPSLSCSALAQWPPSPLIPGSARSLGLPSR